MYSSACILLSWLVAPWQQVESNGTGDGLLYYTFRGYDLSFMPPEVQNSLKHSTTGGVWIQVDWLMIFLEDLLLVFVATLFFVRKNLSVEPDLAVKRTTRGLSLVATIFVAAVASMGFLTYKVSEADSWTLHTYKVIEELNGAILALQDIESGERGYLLTHRPEFAEPLTLGGTAAAVHVNNVETLTADNPTQQSLVVQLRKLVQDKLILSHSNMEQNSTVLPAVLKSQQLSRLAMDECRKQIKRMIENEELLLRKRTGDMRAMQSAAGWLVGLLALLGLFLLWWVVRISNSAIKEEKARVEQLNAEIESRRQTELVLKRTSLELSRSNAELQQFAYVASHDLQEPLRAITGFLGLLSSQKSESLDDDAKKYVNHAVNGAQRMRALIHGLLSFARVESRGKAFKPVSLVRTLQDVRADLDPLINESGAILTVADLPPVNGGRCSDTPTFPESYNQRY